MIVDRAPDFLIQAAPTPPGEASWDTSQLLSEPGSDVLQSPTLSPISGAYTGLQSPPPTPAPRSLRRLLDRVGRGSLVAQVRLIAPSTAYIVATAVAVLLLMWSRWAGVAFVSVPTGHSPADTREVGYVSALNWSGVQLVLFPFAVYLMVSVLQWAPSVLEEAGERGMVRTRSYQLMSGDRLVEQWARGSTVRRILMSVGVVAGIGVGVWDVVAPRLDVLRASGKCMQNSAQIIDWRNVVLCASWPTADPRSDAGMHVGTPASTSESSNVTFVVTAGVWKGLMIGSILAFLILIGDLSRILRTDPDDASWIFVPDLSSPDTRRGFELFEGVVKQVLMVGAIAYVVCNLERLQQLYLSITAVHSFWEFAGTAVRLGATGHADVGKLLEVSAIDLQTVLLSLGTLLVFVFAFLLLASAVQEISVRAARNARYFYRSEPTVTLSGQPANAERGALGDMQKWPLTFPTPYLLMSIFAVGVLSIPFYQIGLYLFGVAIATAVATVMVRLIRRS